MAISKNLLNEGEKIVVDTRTHPKALIIPLFWLVLFLAIAVVVQTLVDNGTVALIVWILAAIGIIWFFVRPFLKWLTATYTITDRRLTIDVGLFARELHETRLERVQNVNSRQSMFERFLGIGTVDFDTAGGVGYGFKFDGVADPHAIVRTVSQALHEGGRLQPGL